MTSRDVTMEVFVKLLYAALAARRLLLLSGLVTKRHVICGSTVLHQIQQQWQMSYFNKGKFIFLLFSNERKATLVGLSLRN